MKNIPFLDLSLQYKALKKDIDQRIHKVLDHAGFVNGPEVTELESVLGDFVGTKHTIACANGTDALLMALMAANIKAGDEIITTSFTFIATVEVILLLGAKPVYVDIDPTTYNIDAKKIATKVTEKTKAIMPVSLYGQASDMDAINQIAKKYSLVVIEDAAQSFGAMYKGKRSCNLSGMAATSFFPAKPLGAYGDGGALFAQEAETAKVLREIRDHGSETRYFHTRLGINGRLDSIQCAVLLAKMSRYEWELKRRDEIAQRYTAGFTEIENPDFQTPKISKDCTSAWAQYTIRVPNRDEFQAKLKELGVPTAVHYPRIAPEQPAYEDQAQAKELHESRMAAQEVLSLPLYPDMPDDHIDYVIEKVVSIARKASN